MTLQEIDPEILTPASRRTLRRLMAVWLISLLGFTIALALYANQTKSAAACVARQYSWDGVHLANELLTIPLSTLGFTGQLREARVQANQQRAEARRVLAAKFGARPEC